FLDTVYLIDTVYPERQNVFAALKETPLDTGRVVILVQDPYPNPDQAQGLSFSVPATIALPKSLINIYKELADDLNVDAPKDGDLRRWAKQGVLLLNTVLTVPAHHAGGHAGEVWEPLTDEIIKLVAQRDQATVFILWGKQAQNKKSLIQGEKNLVLQAPHPSPLSATFYLDRKSTRLNSSHVSISYAVFCLKKKKKTQITPISYSKHRSAT